MHKGKRYNDLQGLVDKNKLYELKEAVDLVKKTARTKFDESVEIAINLNVNSKDILQGIRGTVVLPRGTGKVPRILVLVKGDKLKEAEEAQADYVGSDDLIQKISSGWLDFDVVISTPDMMREVSKLGKILGPKGLMPNPKSGTVTFEIKDTVKQIKAGKVEYRPDSYGIIHSIVGKASFESEALCENIDTLVKSINKSKPHGVKGNFIKNIAISSSMGPGIKINSHQLIN